MEPDIAKRAAHAALLLAESTLNRTKLNKLLFFSDFAHKEKYNEWITGLRYRKAQYGPIPIGFDDIRAFLVQNDYLIYNAAVNGNIAEYRYKSNPKEAFSHSSALGENRIRTLELVKDRLSDYTASYLSEFSHRIDPWKSAQYGDRLENVEPDLYNMIEDGSFRTRVMEGWG